MKFYHNIFSPKTINPTVLALLLSANLLFQIFFFYLEVELKISLLLLTSSLLIIVLFSSKKSLVIPKYFALFFSFYLLLTSISSFSSIQKFTSLIHQLRLLGMFLLTILSVNLSSSLGLRKTFVLLVFPTIILSVFMVLIGILDYTALAEKQKYGLGLFAPFPWPSLMSSFSLLFIPLVFGSLITTRRKIPQLLYFFSLFVFTASLLLSKTNLYLGLFQFSLILVAFKNKIYSKRWVLLIFLLLSLSLMPNLLSSFGVRENPLQRSLFISDLFFSNPREIRKDLFPLIKSSFLGKGGPGNFGTIYNNTIKKPWTWTAFAFNEPLQTAIESGTLAAFSQVVFFFFLAATCFKILLHERDQRFIMALSILPLLITNFSNDFSFRFLPIASLFFLFLGFLFKGNLRCSRFVCLLIALPLFLISILLFHDSLLLRTAKRSFSQKNTRKATMILTRLSKRPEIFLNPKIFFWLSSVSLHQNEKKKALSFLEKAKTIDRENREIDFQIARIFFKLENYLEAERVLEKVKEKNPFLPPKFYLLLLNIKLRLNKNKEALDLTQSIETLFPPNKKFRQGFSLLKERSDLSTLQTLILVSQLVTQGKQE